MNHDSYQDSYIAGILRESRVFALVGASANPARPSFVVTRYLLSQGYAVHPVNPGLAGQQLLGRQVYASLAEVPPPVDVVDIFRNSNAVPDIVHAAIRLKDALRIKVIWMQLGVRNDAAAREAEAAGIRVVMDRCPKIEHARLSAELG